jgi:hypothetical protein
VQLGRTGSLSALTPRETPPVGTDRRTRRCFTSTDNGSSWTRHGEPCPQHNPASPAHGELDSSLSTSDSALGAASATTILASSDLTYRSIDGGRHFTKAADPVAWLGFASSSMGTQTRSTAAPS